MKNLKLTNFDDLHKSWLKDPVYKKAYEGTEPEYQLARSLISARLKRKMTQEELAKKIGTKQPVISRIEAMSQKPSLSLLERIAEALNARVEIRILPK